MISLFKILRKPLTITTELQKQQVMLQSLKVFGASQQMPFGTKSKKNSKITRLPAMKQDLDCAAAGDMFAFNDVNIRDDLSMNNT